MAVRLGIVLALCLLAAPALASANHNSVQLLSGGGPPFSGGLPDRDVQFGAATASASRVVFTTAAALVPSDTDDCDPDPVIGCTDVYERSSGVTTLVSTSATDAHDISWSSYGGMSADGSRIFFDTDAALVPSDTDDCDPSLTETTGCVDVYERFGSVTTLVSAGGNDAHNAFFDGATGDGAEVFFSTSESLVAGDTDACDNGPDLPQGCRDVYRRSGGTTALISTGSSDANTDSSPGFRHVSADGSRIVFESDARLVSADEDDEVDVYERVGTATELVSTGPVADDGPFPASFYDASADGGDILFGSGEQLVADDTDSCDNGLGIPAGCPDVFQRSAGTTTSLVSTGAGGGGGDHPAYGFDFALSDDGSRAFFATAAALVAADTDACDNGPGQPPGCIDVYQRESGVTTLLSTGPTGVNGAHHASLDFASADGSRVYFSTAEQLVAGDTDGCDDSPEPPGCLDSYVRSGGQTTLVSTAPGADSLDRHASWAGESANGSLVLFRTDGPFLPQDLDACDNFDDPPGCQDVYERSDGITRLVTAAANNATDHMDLHAVSADGGRVVLGTYDPVLPDDVYADADLYGADLAPGYVRPKGAGPFRLALVPAAQECAGGANSFHGPALASPSCSPPTPLSDNLTVGTPAGEGGTGGAANSIGHARLDTLGGDSSTLADEADVRIRVSVTDVRCAAAPPGSLPCEPANAQAGADYAGQLSLALRLNITDGFSGPATAEPIDLPVTIGCAISAATTIGSTCALTTTADTLVPGAVIERVRTIWDVAELALDDGGADGDASTQPNDRYMVGGLFAP